MGWRTQLRDLLKLRRDMGAGRAVAQQTLPLQPMAPVDRQPPMTQWIKVAKILSDGVSTVRHVGELQQSSGQLLDAAAYALDMLKAELQGALFVEPARHIQVPSTVGSFRRAMPAPATALAA